MAIANSNWYINYGSHFAVAARPQNAAVTPGMLRRQSSAPALGSERVFICIVGGTTANVTDATWTLTRGAKTSDGTAVWQECTGWPALNVAATRTLFWSNGTTGGIA